MTDLALGINLWSQATSWTAYLDAARRVDRLGYRSLWTFDHLYAPFGDPHQDIFEGYVTLGAWATTTRNVDLGLMVGANTFRNPALAAQMATTLDHASGGRSWAWAAPGSSSMACCTSTARRWGATSARSAGR